MFRRLTTEEPQGNVQWMHNMTGIKNREVYLRDYNGEGDLSLVDYCKKECNERCDIDIDVGAEEFGEYMYCGCIVAQFYWIAVGHAELRAHLSEYEDSGLSYKEVKNLQSLNRELVHVIEYTKIAIRNGLDLGYIHKCDSSYVWYRKVIEALEKVRAVK